jgi:uncharacterized membrane protein
MKIIGGITSHIGQQRKLDHVLAAARRRAYRGTRNVSTSGGVSVLAAGTDIISLARQRIQQSFPQSEVRVGICSSPTSASFPDGKIHPGIKTN